MEYRSRLGVFGLPLVHIATGSVDKRCYRARCGDGLIRFGGYCGRSAVRCGDVAFGGMSVGCITAGVAPVGLAVANGYAIGGLALAHTVLAEPNSKLLPLSSIPHAPFQLSDALLLMDIWLAVLAIVRSIQTRRRE